MSSRLRRLLDQNAREILEKEKDDYGKEIMRKSISRAVDDGRDQVTEADVRHILSNESDKSNSFLKTISKWFILILSCGICILIIILFVYSINSEYSIIDMTDPTIRSNYYLAVISSGIVLGLGSYKWVLKDYIDNRI